ncbi:glycoside hydrolase family 88 protein [Mucisphaera calidilacus]|uniref:Unsaturated glucuronyl hydrolase n=1 Tax=Mucisphaera calidilacus TaxID=2527982 RepID=A0A518C0B7_9BACT|nr:glycoside hydrolase family 88 protein [Mucisphaera calidilacus]QDU72657.1 Unsaturated glucuronyl hydrolase [Mucisphaera calidilacus]
MIHVDTQIEPSTLLPAIERMWALSADKIRAIEQSFPPGSPSPVFTVAGQYSAQGWTEWTQGFQYGAAALQFDATGDTEFLDLARDRTRQVMAPHLTHTGVHDHGFNNVSTYGNLWRLAKEHRFEASADEIDFYELALKVTGAVQASRWSTTADGTGYIYSFNGPQSLFVDTIRSCRALAVSHQLGHVLQGERDARISLLGRIIEHARNTARYNIWYGPDSENGPRDTYDVRGRTAHESVFNTNNGDYRCPSTQQGYSAFSTWTRGLAWAMLGYPEQLEFIQTLADDQLEPFGGRDAITAFMLEAARATCDFYIEQTPVDGVPYWDTGAPGLAKMGDYLDRPAEPLNDHEPVDSSAAAIGCQGLIRLGIYLKDSDPQAAGRYLKAGLTSLQSLLTDTYLGTDPGHQGLLLHTVYHRPNGWDHIPEGCSIPCGEAAMWGDYHLREAALTVQRLANNQTPYTFFGPVEKGGAT